VKVRKKGRGTLSDPIQPDLEQIPEIRELHGLLETFRSSGEEIRNRTFYICEVVGETEDEFEVEIKEPEKPIREIIDELKAKLG